MSGRRAPSSIPASCVVYTPRPLADAIVAALGDSGRDTWLEPCVGGGVFVEALASIGVPRRRIRALDLEPVRQASDAKARTLRGREFLAWSEETRERFSRIVANPPFVALNRLPARIRDSALRIAIPDGGNVALGSNCWVAFLCASLHLLEQGGSLGFILPASWEYSDYAEPLRTTFPRLFGEVQVHRCARPLFPAVQEGSVVLVARQFVGDGNRKSKSLKAHHVFHAGPEQLIDTLKDGAGDLQAVRRPARRKARKGSTTESKTVGDVMQIRLGGVTGDAKYFVFSDDDRRNNKIPAAACRPVISRAHHLLHGLIGKRDWQSLRDAGERVWLFDPTPRQAKHESVATYLRKRPSTGGCNRTAFKVSSRSPWYRTPMPSGVHGFMSGMSSWGPWVVFSDMPGLGATNTLYVVRFIDAATADEKAAWAMWLLTSGVQRKLRRIGRHYANGLIKFEPSDIARLPITTPIKIRGAFGAYKRAVQLLLSGDASGSRCIADQWCGSGAEAVATSLDQTTDGPMTPTD
jgi:adenine-specific DNA-methyltransferase